MYRCPKCHVELPVDARFCKNCGFNQTNARIAAMSPPVPGVQRQVPPQIQQGAQQSPTRTIQPQNRHIPQQPTAQRQGPPAQPNIQVSQQNVPGRTSFTQQQASGHPSTAQNVSWSMSPVVPRPQQGETPLKNNVTQQPTHSPMTPPLKNPQQGQGWGRPNQGIAEQVMRTSTPPPTIQEKYTANTPFEPLQWGLGALPDTPVSVESLEATSKAAQHWRQSWLDRQHAEAGPAVDVSRGQASVPEPLLAMQHSFARMRAIILPKNAGDREASRLRFWLPVLLLVCLIGGLGTYILSTYSTGFFSTTLASASTNTEPTLTMKAAKTTTVAAGQTIQVHGEHFGVNDPILFFLGDTQLKTANSTQSNAKGVFDTSLLIPATQLAGEYTVQAHDNHTGQYAFLNILTTASTTTDRLKLSVPSLAFASSVGHNNPPGQNVSITNTSNAAIQWSAIAISDNQTGWLLLDNAKTSGQLNAGQTDKIRVNVITQGLASSPDKQHPYTGEIIFTLQDQGQVTLPVQLTISETGFELIINPNPLVALASPTIPGGCQDTTLTLINLSNIAVNWEVQANGLSQQHITLDGKPDEKGQLFPSGLPNDTQVIKIGCNGVQQDMTYAVNVFYNGSQQLIPISVVKG
ncbi:MAG: hypothetical protein NVS4B1_05320 [Ktedonobacteraceae bacterium]